MRPKYNQWFVSLTSKGIGRIKINFLRKYFPDEIELGTRSRAFSLSDGHE